MLAAERLDRAGAEAGKALVEVEAAIVALYDAINFSAPTDSYVEEVFSSLGHVKSLLEVAIALYPYPID